MAGSQVSASYDSDQDNEVDVSPSARLLNAHDGLQTSEYCQNSREKPTAGKGEDRHLSEPLKICPGNGKRAILTACLLAATCLVFFLVITRLRPSHRSKIAHQSAHPQLVSGFSGERNTFTFTNGTEFSKPRGLKIIGIIFYGRRQFVSILECYLRRNLRVNGGMLDQVHFLMHTDVENDITWLQRLVQKNNMKKYYKLKVEDTGGDWRKFGTFPELYKRFMTDPQAIYIKIDDDVIFLDDHAIPELIRTTLEHPEAHNIQANMVNNKWNHWHHLRTNAIWPYLPDSDASSKWLETSWRPSDLPRFKGDLPPKNPQFDDHNYKPPNKGHRWLPLDPTSKNLDRTPYGQNIRNPMFKSPSTEPGWAIAAQAHFSFFENFERGQLMRYAFGSSYDQTWNRRYTRYNINLMAIRGSVILQHPLWSKHYLEVSQSEEFLLTVKIPKDLDMPVLIATKAIAAHFSFRKTRRQLLETDILERYKALAEEYYCPLNAFHQSVGSRFNPHHIKSPENLNGNDQYPQGDDLIGDGPQDINNAEHDDDQSQSSSY